METKTKKSVNDALDQVKKILGLQSDRQLALLLDLEKQNVATWRARGEVPAHRAVQLEISTDHKITINELCPNLFRKTEELLGKK